MIKKLPQIYDGELFYSFLARAYSQSGLLFNKSFRQEAFEKESTQIDFMFLTPLSKPFFGLIGGEEAVGDFLMNHTLFKYYARFLKGSAAKRIFEIGRFGFEPISKFLPISCSMGKRNLMYCPLCLNEDRKKYGEGYFHVEHQIPRMPVCPHHGCGLLDSSLKMTKTFDKPLVPLEQLDLKETVEETPLGAHEFAYAKYLNQTFSSPMDFEGEGLIGDFLISRLKNDYFLDKSRRSKNITKIFRDMEQLFVNQSFFELTQNRLGRMFRQERFNVNDVMMTAFFEEIPADELIIFWKLIKPIPRPIAKQAEEMLSVGYTLPKIASLTGLSEERIERNLNRKRIALTSSRNHLARKNWPEIDDDCCSAFHETIEKALESNPGAVINKEFVAKTLGIGDRTLRHFPKLRALITTYRLRIS